MRRPVAGAALRGAGRRTNGTTHAASRLLDGAVAFDALPRRAQRAVVRLAVGDHLRARCSACAISSFDGSALSYPPVVVAAARWRRLNSVRVYPAIAASPRGDPKAKCAGTSANVRRTVHSIVARECIDERVRRSWQIPRLSASQSPAPSTLAAAPGGTAIRPAWRCAHHCDRRSPPSESRPARAAARRGCSQIIRLTGKICPRSASGSACASSVSQGPRRDHRARSVVAARPRGSHRAARRPRAGSAPRRPSSACAGWGDVSRRAALSGERSPRGRSFRRRHRLHRSKQPGSSSGAGGGGLGEFGRRACGDDERAPRAASAAAAVAKPGGRRIELAVGVATRSSPDSRST